MHHKSDEDCRAINRLHVLCFILAFKSQMKVRSKFDLKCWYCWKDYEVLCDFLKAESMKTFKYKRIVVPKHLCSKCLGVGR